MRLQALSLVNFRNHELFSYQFDEDQVVFVAPNGFGKTNILEAIHLLTTGETFREAKSEEMVNFTAEVSHLGGSVKEAETAHQTELRVTLTRGHWQGKRVSKKKFQVNGVGRSKATFLGNISAVSFRPEDLRIIEGSPARRRKFLDTILVQADTNYAKALNIYTKALRQRNKLLVMIREQQTHPRALEYWDELVIKNGEYINQKRQEMITFFNQEEAFLASHDSQYELEYDHSIMSRERLERYKMQEMSAGYTLVGPHRDDILVNTNLEIRNVKNEEVLYDLAKYGSRGQQRMGVLWLKLRSLAFIESQTGSKPILLLDDIFSELDHEHREVVFALMKKYQTVATTADRHYVEGIPATVVDLENQI